MISQIEHIVLKDKEVLATSHFNASNDKTDTYECIFSYNGVNGHFFYYIEKSKADNLLNALLDFCNDVIDYMDYPEMALDAQVERANSFINVFGDNRKVAVQMLQIYEDEYCDRKRKEELRSMVFSSKFNKLYDSAVKHIYDAIVMSGLFLDDETIAGVELSYFDKNRFEVNMLYVRDNKLLFIADMKEEDLDFGKDIKEMDIKQLLMIADNIYEIIDNAKDNLQ